MADRVDMNWTELNKLFPKYEFENGEDAVKMAVFYFIKLAMMNRERRQHMDWTMLSVIDAVNMPI